MGSTKLKQDLSNCLINFDRRVLLTELLDDYQVAYEEVNSIVEKFVEEQQMKDNLKFNKRYIVHGKQQGEHKKEIFKIVEESKLKEWLKKLENAQSSLYSVEVAGGSKAAAAVFKPISVLKNVKIKNRIDTNASVSNGNTETTKPNKAVEKKEVKQETNLSKGISESPSNSLKSTSKVEVSAKKTSPKTEISPSDKKAVDKKFAQKKGINNFFAPSTAAAKKSTDIKDSKAASGVVKPPTPKKMQDFFKKQEEKPKTTTETRNKTTANTSVQLFNDEQEEETEEISSDEEEKLDALKRDIFSSDVEIDAEEEHEAKHTNSSKRRRILDSEDEDEDPPIKQEKLDVKEETKVEEAAVETYLDEDGFVITKKSKHSTTANKSPATKKTPPVTLKASPKGSKKSTTSKDIKAATNAAGKSKQAGILNFFSKK